MQEDFQILTPRDHVRLRIGMYLGSSSLESVERFLNGKWGAYQYVPAIIKSVDEIIDNSIDEAIRTNFKFANKIDVTFQKGVFSVRDNGRGIPQDEIIDSDGEKVLRPVAAWTKTNAGTSFGDDRTTIGANGVGSACVHYVSSRFMGETSDGKNTIIVTSTDGADTVNVNIKGSDGQTYTKVSFMPDFDVFTVDDIDETIVTNLIKDRLNALSISYPKIKLTFNSDPVVMNIKKYSYLYLEEGNLHTVTHSSNDVDFLFTSSHDGYRSTSYINGVNTRLGGSYNDYIVNIVADNISDMIKKKYKVTVKRTLVKSGLTFVMFARNFENAKYDSQTKERLTNSQKEITTHFNKTGIDLDDLSKKVFECPEIIEPIIEAQLAKKLAAEKRAATLAQKKLNKVKVEKHVPANGKRGKDETVLMLVEGDSAMGFFLATRNPNKHGAFPLKGVPKNAWGSSANDVLSNVELANVIAVLGLDINDSDSWEGMNYDKVAIFTDADNDGHHIAFLLLGFFYQFWPKMIENGSVVLLKSPIMISNKGKSVNWVYDYSQMKKFKEENPKGWTHNYIKGLGTLSESDYEKVINEPKYEIINVDDPEFFENILGDDPEKRKVWLMGEEHE